MKMENVQRIDESPMLSNFQSISYTKNQFILDFELGCQYNSTTKE